MRAMVPTKSAIAIPLACCLLLAAATPLASARMLQPEPQPIVSGGTFGGSVGTDLNFKFAYGGAPIPQARTRR